jgi:NAD(P)-dependent dehydrogenase (short-subunit alcohol dehydrogenase family)
VANLSDESQIRELFATIGTFDHLVYTAGESLQLTELSTLNFAEAQAAWNLRFWGAFAAAKYASPHIRTGGSIVLTTGVAKDRPLKGWTNAASICGAVEALTRALAIELAPIRVNAVAPGVVRTPMWNTMTDADRDALYRNVGERLPVGRVGEAADIAETYLYLMREAFSTGQTITVDGGTMLV